MSKSYDHGTRASYSAGCRCDACKAAWADYIRDYKQRTGRAQPRDVLLVDREIAQAEQRLVDVVDSEDDAALTVPLSPLALSILTEWQRKSRRRRGDLIDQLLREHGPNALAHVA